MLKLGQETACLLSFGSKFYRGMQEFTIADGDNKALSLKCNIANVVVSVNPDALSLGITDLKVTFSHSREVWNLRKIIFVMPKGIS